MDERGWMRHSVALCKERVRTFKPEHPSPVDPALFLKWMEWELAWREHVLAVTSRGDTSGLSEMGRVWWRYMRNHAKAQVKRYSNEITEAEFHARARMLRSARNEAIERYTGKKVA